MKRFAIFSVWDKSGAAGFAKVLTDSGFAILATSKTADELRRAQILVTEISDFTGSPEILGGRVKTLHPKIAAGILSTRDDPSIAPIDIVVCNLYPFAAGVERGASCEELIELIDIGGVTLLRAAAKNHSFVTPVPDPSYYDRVGSEIEARGIVPNELRVELARRAFEITSQYDARIARYLGSLAK